MDILKRLESGDIAYQLDRAIIQEFGGKRSVLSTSAYNGGLSKELTSVFNYDEMSHGNGMCEMKADTYENHLKIIAKDIGITNINKCTGLSTAAKMKNVSVESLSCDDVEVTAIVTGGININGGRAGDPASWKETKNGIVLVGTINIFLNINANLSDGAMAVALMTCTEAKAVALQELQLPSKYSNGIATGSGTDGVIIVANAEKDIMLTDAGKHSKLGELIGKTVINAIKKAVFLQTNVCPKSQYNVEQRLERFGFKVKLMYSEYRNLLRVSEETFYNDLYIVCSSNEIITKAIVLSHLLDELIWGLITNQVANIAISELLEIKYSEDILGQYSVEYFIQMFEKYLVRKTIN